MQSGPLLCPACGAALSPWRSVESAEPELGPRWLVLARCSRCGTAVTLGAPIPSAHSSGAYGDGRPRGARWAGPLLARFDRERLRLLAGAGAGAGAGLTRPARLVDAGAGRGRFIAAARAAGYDAVGVEPSLRDVDPRSGLIATTIESAPVAPGSADVVTLWHVLEHLEDPAVALETLAGWLRRDGVLLVGLPNLGSLQARLTGGRWYHLDLPRHRAHYTVAGAVTLLERSGFEVVEVQHTLSEHNLFGMWQSLVSLGTRRPSYLYNLLKRNAPLWCGDLVLTVAALPWLPVAMLAERLAGRAGYGGTVAVLARRRRRRPGEV